MPSQKLNKWIRWQRIILDDVIRLHACKQIYDNYIQILNKSESVRSEGVLFHNWIVDNYVTFVALTIRRQAELPKANNKDVISLGKLITDIRDNPKELTRAFYISLYVNTPDEFQEELANQDFTKHGGTGEYFDRKIAKADLVTLAKATKKIEDLATVSIAHHTKKKHPELTFNEVNECIDIIKGLTQKYVLLLTAGWNTVDPVMDYWQGIFTRPWIKKDQL